MLISGMSNKTLASVAILVLGLIWAANNTDIGKKYLGGGSGFFGL